MKDEEAIDWRERFPTFHRIRKTSSRRSDRRLTKESGILCVFFGRRRKMSVWEIFSSYVWKNVVHGRKMCANKNHEGTLCVVSSCSRVHERIFMMKPLDS